MAINEILDQMEGAWESVNLNPAVVVLCNFEGTYRLMILHVDVYTRQAHPAIHDVEQDEQGFYIGMASNRQRVEYDPVSDTLNLSVYGEYMRN